MKTHRIVLLRDQHAAALAGVDRLLLPMDLRRQGFDSAQPAERIAGAWCRLEVNGWAWWGPLNEDGRALRYQQGVNCPYKPGDRLALLERFADIPGGAPYYEINVHGPYWRSEVEPGEIKWSTASRMPLRACRCFYRVMAAPNGSFVRVEPVLQPKLSDQDAGGVVGAWVWGVPVEREG